MINNNLMGILGSLLRVNMSRADTRSHLTHSVLVVIGVPSNPVARLESSLPG